jgi:IS5 family transposase
MKEAYGHLIAVARQSVDQARRVQDALGTPEAGVAAKLAQQLDTFVPRAEGILAQAQRRVLLGETVPAPEKRVSLFEPQTQIVNRGKPSRPVEFGRKVQFEEVEGGIVSGYRVQAEPGSDAPYLKASLEKHRALFGKAPDLLSTDRGYYSPANVQLAQEAGVKRVVIPVAGKATVAQKQQEKERWFRRGYRFRAGSEGRISVLKRRFGLRRCLDHGEPGFERWVGMGVVTSNLLQIARATVGS